jgi:adenine-specific DNA-methyltransferase
MTSKYDYYELKDESAGIECGFIYKTVPHITLKSIAQNPALDPIFDKHQPILDAKLAELNAKLAKVDEKIRQKLALKLTEKQKKEGKSAVTDADKRRWVLPKKEWKEWEVPFDTDPDWPEPLQKALVEYRKAWRAKMDEINACISANADQEELVDQPKIVPKVVRVSGPFTMEGVIPIEDSFSSPIGGAPEGLETFESSKADGVVATMNAEAYLDKMLRLLKTDGVRFPNNKVMKFLTLEFAGGEFLHAEGEWKVSEDKNGARKVAVSFGPEHGSVTGYQVQNALRSAFKRGHDDLVLAGFSFDAEAQAIISEDNNPKVRCHLAHITPDVNMGDLLKETRNSQLFTVFGSPRTRIDKLEDGQFQITMEGVDIYNPIENAIEPTVAEKVAAWFVDSDYDGMTFCITQAFFPDKGAWEKLAKALKGTIDDGVFDKFSGTVSLPFPLGKNKRVAIKVIDPRGNEVMSVHRLDGKYEGGR